MHNYDAVGNLTQLTYPSGANVRGQYGPDGDLKQATNARGQTTTSTLLPNDPLLESLLHADGHSEHFQYDAFGRNTQVSDRILLPQAPGNLGSYDNASGSDAADNLTLLRGVTQTSNADNQLVSEGNNGAAYAYDLDGNPTLEEGVNAEYDDAGHLTSYNNVALGVHLRMGYRPDGLRAWKQVDNGMRMYYFYDGERLTMEMYENGTIRICYGWGAAGLEQIDAYGTAAEPANFYAFDPQGNVASRMWLGLPADQAYYDAFGNLIADLSINNNGGGVMSGAMIQWGGAVNGEPTPTYSAGVASRARRVIRAMRA